MHNFKLLFGQFLGQAEQIMPDSLNALPSHGSWTIGIILFTGLVLIAATRAFEANYLKGLISTYFSASTREDIQKSDIDLNSLSSVLLVICGFIGFWLCTFLAIEEFTTLKGLTAFLWSALASFFYLGLQISMLGLAAFVSGEFPRLRDNFVQTLLNIQFTGVLLYFVGLIWYLNPQFGEVFAKIFAGVLLISAVVRLLKGIYVSLTNRVSWYYIILYFCTFEILPIYVIYVLVIRNFEA